MVIKVYENNTIVTASLGQGGAGLTNIMCSQDTERIKEFIEELNEMKFDGVVEASEDIQDSECWLEGVSVAYQWGVVIKLTASLTVMS